MEDISPANIMAQLMLEKMARKTWSTRRHLATDNATIRLDCERELHGYLEVDGESIMDDKGNYVNPGG